MIGRVAAVAAVVLAVVVVGLAVAFWWVSRIRGSERDALTAAQRAQVDARIMKQYRSGPRS